MQYHFTFQGKKLVALGDGRPSDVVVASLGRRLKPAQVTLNPGDAPGHYIARWFDAKRDVFCEAPVVISREAHPPVEVRFTPATMSLLGWQVRVTSTDARVDQRLFIASTKSAVERQARRACDEALGRRQWKEVQP